MMSGQKQILYLVSSTAKPYIKDMVDIFFLPSNFTYRFRYDLIWVANQLQSDEELNRLPDEGIIVHSHISEHTNNGIKEYRIEELIPVRKITITEKKIVGDFVLIQFKLDSYVKFPKVDVGKKNPYHNDLMKLMPAPTQISKKYISSKLAFVASSINIDFVGDSMNQSERSDAIVNWSNLASHIGKLQPHIDNKSMFTKLLSISNMKGNNITPSELSPDSYGFELKSNATYRIRILQRAFDSVTPFYLDLSIDPAILKPIKQQALIQGKYDVLELIVATSNPDKSIYTSLLIKPESSPHSVASFTCTCLVKINNAKRAVLFIAIGLGIAATGATSLSTDPAVKALLTAIGATLVGISTFFLKR